MQTLENRIPPPLVMAMIAAAMWLASSGTPALAMPDAIRQIVSAILFSFAGVFAVAAFRAFGRAGTTADPVKIEKASALVTTGVYGWTRNPMYVSLALLLLAWSVYLASPWAFLGPVLFVLLITRFQIMPEERMLGAKFGVAYADYQRRVRRWL